MVAPGQSRSPRLRIGAMICGVRAGGGDTGLGVPTALTVIALSARTLPSVAWTASTETPGRIRQLTLACACCGNAFGAWPALTIVATHVVRSMLFQLALSAQS